MATAEPAFRAGALLERFVAPPFSVLDTRQGYWQERRRSWLSLGLKSELGRGADAQAYGTGATREGGLAATSVGARGGLISAAAERRAERMLAGAGLLYDDEVTRTVARMGTDYDTEAGENAWGGSGTSIFDPVLCELAYRWWAPPGGRVLDPFAGGSVRGVVAGMLGHPYTGVDLSGAQLEANRAQALDILRTEHPMPRWLHGDTLEVLPTLEAGYDMVLTCPPYYDLEVYSDDPRDLSNVTWGQFVELYSRAMALSAHLLAADRFSVWVVSEIRDPEGYCRGLVPLTVQVAEAAGLRLYNEAILVNSPGSLPVRVTRYMEASRKLGRSHQNVLCFIKGAPPRGWSYDRAAPPRPQLELFGAEPASPTEALAATVPQEVPTREVEIQPAPEQDTLQAEAVLTFAPAEQWPADLKWDGVIRCEDHEPGYHATAEEALECSAETMGEAGWDALVATGEEQAVPQPAPGPAAAEAPAVAPEPTPQAPAAPGPLSSLASREAGSWRQLEDERWVDEATGEIAPAPATTPLRRRPLPVHSSVPAPMAQEDWELARGRDWSPGDPERPCWTCGRPPTGRHPDGSPSYDHSHNAEALAMFSDEEGTP